MAQDNLARNLVGEQEQPAVDPKQFRAAMGAFATGVAIVTTQHEGRRYGMAVNSLTSVSLDPCLLLICTKRGSETAAAIRTRGEFAVNLLANDQHHLVKQFCGNPDDRFTGLSPLDSECGMPLVPGSIVHMCCTIQDVHVSGDHEIVIGRVHSIADNAGEPLLFFRGSYGHYHPHPQAVRERVAV
jgi:3-hydroxy-9,10-secoandrosta-1,3,5(10)-triene-9,17-dione monooxygenase reductase component